MLCDKVQGLARELGGLAEGERNLVHQHPVQFVLFSITYLHFRQENVSNRNDLVAESYLHVLISVTNNNEKISLFMTYE